MAKIKFGKKGHLELEITPLTIWSNPGSEGEFMEYQLGLYCEGESVFNPALAEKLVAVKDEESIYLSDFIAETLAFRRLRRAVPPITCRIIFCCKSRWSKTSLPGKTKCSARIPTQG